MTTADKVRKIISEHLGSDLEKTAPDANLHDTLGGDSLDDVEIVMEMEEEFSILISDKEAENLSTVQDIVTLVERKMG